MPPTTGSTGTFKFQIYNQYLGNFYLVDEGSNTNLITAT